jgi:hypothetical protein
METFINREDFRVQEYAENERMEFISVRKKYKAINRVSAEHATF